MRQRGPAASGIAKCLLRACYRAMTIKTKYNKFVTYSYPSFLLAKILYSKCFYFLVFMVMSLPQGIAKITLQSRLPPAPSASYK